MMDTKSDRDLIVDRLLAFLDLDPAEPSSWIPEHVIQFSHAGAPVPKERARWSPKHKRMFTPTRTRASEGDLLYAWRVALNRRLPLVDTCAIVAIFFVPTRRRKDVDNLMKLVMDAATRAGVWNDDSQVIAQASYLELDRDRPRTLVAVCPYLSTLSQTPLLTATGAHAKGGQ
jgi:Holliday junction resolvase RusA-like endonuclease